MENYTIEIIVHESDQKKVKQYLKDERDIDTFKIVAKDRSGSISPEIIVALIAAGGVTVAALISGLFSYFKELDKEEGMSKERKFIFEIHSNKEMRKIEISGYDYESTIKLLDKYIDKNEIKLIETKK